MELISSGDWLATAPALRIERVEDVEVPLMQGAIVSRGDYEPLVVNSGNSVRHWQPDPRRFVIRADEARQRWSAAEDGPFTLPVGGNRFHDVRIHDGRGDLRFCVRRRRGLSARTEVLDANQQVRWSLSFESGAWSFRDHDGLVRAELREVEKRMELMDLEEVGTVGALALASANTYTCSFSEHSKPYHRTLLIAAAFWLDRR